MVETIFSDKKRICARLGGISKSTLARLVKERGFPKPMAFRSGGKSYWIDSEVNDWCLAQPRKTLKPPQKSDGEQTGGTVPPPPE